MHALTYATGGLLKVKKPSESHVPVVCGGRGPNHEGNNKCYLLEGITDMVKQTVVGQMREMRQGAASIAAVDGTVLWVTGGKFATTVAASDTTEWLNIESLSAKIDTLNSSKTSLSKGMPLPRRLTFHCLEKINSKTAILYGGTEWVQHEEGLRYTWTIGNLDSISTILNVDNSEQSQQQLWTPRADMELARYHHSCGVVREDISVNTRRKIVVAAGGANEHDSRTDHVELLKIEEDEAGNIAYVSNQWEEGPPLPTNLREAASATTGDQSMLFVAGGLVKPGDSAISSTAIYSFRCALGACWWTKDNVELNFFWSNAEAFIIPPFVKSQCILLKGSYYFATCAAFCHLMPP